MARYLLLVSMLLLTLSMVLATFAESTWVLWGAKKNQIINSELGLHAAWIYVDAFTTKQECREGKDKYRDEGHRYQCVPVEIDPNETIFR